MLLARPLSTSLLLLALLSPATAQDAGVLGQWTLGLLQPGVVEFQQAPFTVQAPAADDAETIRATVTLSGREVVFSGTFADDVLSLTSTEGLAAATLRAELRDGRLRGSVRVTPLVEIPVEAWRPTEATAEPAVVDFDVPRPTQVDREGLPEHVAPAASAAIEKFMTRERAVGLSAAFVIDGRVADVRSFGWEDFVARVPASSRTMYRWASISKPLTAVVALQLAERKQLDLDADVRGLVPEYDKGAALTCRQLLCHQAGVTHYRDMRVRSVKDYDVPHPWADRILALDMFVETDLLSEPGSAYLYSTPGYVVLGAVLQRAGEATYASLVAENVCAPLGMEGMQPDYQWVEIAHRTVGYRREGERVIDTGDDDISWKLPAGGWISTVEDLGRFGAGLMGGELLRLPSQLAMWERQTTAGGERTPYGLGVNVGEVAGEMTIAHGGAQKKTSTYLLCCPGRNVAVALMCNTEGTPLAGLAGELLELLLAE